MRRVGWGVLDQALSSASNVLFVLALARLLDPATFGLYVLAYTALAACLAICRGGMGTLITLSAEDPEHARDEGQRAITAVGLVGILLALIAAFAMIATGSPVHPVMAMALPVLLVQDMARVTALALGRPTIAVAGDFLWFLVSAGMLVVTWFGIRYGAPAAVTLWVLAGALSTGIIVGRLRLRPSVWISPIWAAPTRGDRIRFTAEASVAALGSLALTTGVTGLIGPVANAALRGAGTVVGPINVLLTSLQVALVPEMRRRGATGYRELSRLSLPVVGVIAACAVAISGLAIVLPSSVGSLLLGESWTVVAPVLVIVGIEYIGQAILANGTTILRARAASRQLLRVRLTMTTLQISAGLTAAAAFGTAAAVATGSAIVVWLVAIGVNLRLGRERTGARLDAPLQSNT